MRREYSEQDILCALAERHPMRLWVFAAHVGVSGYGGRVADAVAWNGGQSIGYEVKVSRPDWLAEIANPAKHMSLRRAVRRFYFAMPGYVYRDGDIDVDGPFAGCGVMLWYGEKWEVRLSAESVEPLLSDSQHLLYAVAVRQQSDLVSGTALNATKRRVRLVFSPTLEAQA